jgi:hypothetical protein
MYTTLKPQQQQRPLLAARSDRGAAASARRPLSLTVRAAYASVPPADVDKLVQDKGFVLLDLRTQQEHDAQAKRFCKNIPIGLEVRS